MSGEKTEQNQPTAMSLEDLKAVRARLVTHLETEFGSLAKRIATGLGWADGGKRAITVMVQMTEVQMRNRRVGSLSFAQIEKRMPKDFEGVEIKLSFSGPAVTF